MLKSLRLKDFAIFKDITVPFSDRLCIISGETGAGKSIMVDGMLALLGTRTDAGVVREGAHEATIEGLFDLEDVSPAAVFLQEHGFEVQDELVLKRSINAQGKSRVSINGALSTLSLLSGLTKLLVDIHGQHEHQSLLDEQTHIHLLDAYAGAREAADKVGTLFASLLQTTARAKKLQSDSAELKKEEELLKFQLAEIRAADLRPDEEAGLEREYAILTNAQRMLADLNTVYDGIAGDENGILAQVHRVLKIIAGLQGVDPDLRQYGDRVEAVSIELKDVAAELSAYLSKIDMDPQRLEQTEQRIGLIDRLKKKYGKTIADMVNYGQGIERRLGALTSADEEIAALGREQERLGQDLYRAAADLSKMRRHAAAALGKAVARELTTLGMKDAVFEIRITDNDQKDALSVRDKKINAHGMDSVRFYFSANPGFPAKPLTEIISGGELSRTMLAMKRALVTASPVPVLVFDEIDTGIGGTTAGIVGRKLKELAQYHQVICITHLPQIAGFGDYHIRVAKHAGRGTTDVVVDVLDEKERIEEIARMLSGDDVTDLARRQAKEFIKSAKENT